MGLRVVGDIKQNLKSADPAFLIGSGKRKELAGKIEELSPRYVIFDHALSGVQIRNLEKQLKIYILDRDQLIVEIFAHRAKTREGKLQAQLARLLDQMPRMTGAWLGSLSRQGGGRSAKGPGEKALETDRRRAREKIRHIKKKLKKVSQNRSLHRAVRQKRQIPSFALIGYTNSGKSSLLNCLTQSRAETKDQLFMTLDPSTKKIFVPGLSEAVITDTVGFIRNLPPHLISAFKATLEESAQADILLHVIDMADPQINRCISVVNGLIKSLEWHDKPLIHVFNKSDLIPFRETALSPKFRPRAVVSAKTGYGMDTLLKQMKTAVTQLCYETKLFFPKEKEHDIYKLSRTTDIQKKETGRRGSICHAKLTARQIKEWKDHIIN